MDLETQFYSTSVSTPPPNVAKQYIENTNITWDFNAKNDIGQTVYDYYGKTTGRDQNIYTLLGEKCGIQIASLPGMYMYHVTH